MEDLPKLQAGIESNIATKDVSTVSMIENFRGESQGISVQDFFKQLECASLLGN